MNMLKAGLAVAALLIGAMAVLTGGVVMLSALKEGRIDISYGTGAAAQNEMVMRNSADSMRFWTLFAALGGLPVLGGIFLMRWGWRTING